MQRKAGLAVVAAVATAAALLPAVSASTTELPALDASSLRAGSVPVRAAPTSAGTFLVTGTGRAATASGAAAGLDDATIEDLTAYARASGRDQAAVIAAHQGIHEFSAYATELEQTRPDKFVRAGLATEGPADYWVQFTARPGADIVAELARLPVNTEVQYGAPASFRELEDLAYAVTTSLVARRDVVRSAVTSYDHERRVFRVRYAPAGGPHPATLDSAFQEAVTMGAVAGELPLEVVPELDPDLAAAPGVTVQGGRNLNSATATCTAGFTARRNGNRGLLTARHCPNNFAFGNTHGALAAAVQPPTNAYDIQWHRTATWNGHTTNRQFRATCWESRCDRTVTRVANPPIGSTVCHWGRATGHGCSTVVDTNICIVYTDGVRRCGQDYTASNVAAPGDSGGPWFLGSTARGIHSGNSSEASIFTRIGRVRRELDARVLHS